MPKKCHEGRSRILLRGGGRKGEREGGKDEWMGQAGV